MNKKLKIILISLCALVLVAAAAVIAVISAKNAAEVLPTPTPSPVATAEPTPTPEQKPEEAISATIAVGGDVVMHSGLNTEAKTDKGYDYVPIFGTLTEAVKAADYSVCSLVTTFAQGEKYSAFPFFKSPDALADSLAAVGFDMVNTATSHALDSYKVGVDYTLDVLDAAGLAHVGTYRTPEERTAAKGANIVDINGISVAFMSYTCDTNRISASGFESAVNICTTDYLTGASSIDYDLISADMASVRESGADFIFVFMSWGKEFDAQPNDMQVSLADYLFTQGADIIIGGHIRVPQHMETREVTDINGNVKTGYLCYSLGNLLSCQNDAYTDISAIVNIELSKGKETGKTWISSVSYDPICMVDLYDYNINDYGWHYRLASLHGAIDAYDAGKPWDFMTEEIYTGMQSSLEKLHEYFGSELDAGGK
ncbi:MAG: CapA family protein [Oscillospiraceae bacterium]